MTGTAALRVAYIVTGLVLLVYPGWLLRRFWWKEEEGKDLQTAKGIQHAARVAEILLARKRKFRAAEWAGWKWTAVIAVMSSLTVLICAVNRLAIPGVVLYGPSSWGATWVKLFVTRRRARGEKVILWLRHFHEYQLLSFRFRKVLQASSKGFGVPITLRDHSVRTSLAWTDARVDAFQPLIFVAFIVLWLSLINYDLVSFSAPMFFATYGAYTLFIYGLFSSFAFVRLKATTAGERSEHLIENLHNTFGLYNGLVIVRCENTFWHGTVKCFVDHADVVLIDITKISENVAWELGIVMSSVGRQRWT